jgi:hypothetical protein
MSTKNSSSYSGAQMLLPLSLVAFVVFLGTAFQTVQVFRERAFLHQTKMQQEKPLEEVRRVQAQLDALAVGTLKLANQGDKNAQAIIDRLKQIGITVAPPKSGDTLPSSPAAATLPPKF